MTLDYDPIALNEALAIGRSVLVRGHLAASLAPPPGMFLIRIRCDVDAPLDAIESAVRAALRVSGDGRAGKNERQNGVESLTRAVNRLSSRSHGGVVLALEGLSSVDASSLDVLSLLMTSPGAVRVRVVFAFDRQSLDGAAAALHRDLSRVGAVDVTVDPRAVARQRELSQALRALSADELLTLRAAAVLGDGVLVDAVAAVRELSLVRVLEQFQRARDLGVPLVDDGSGHIKLTDELGVRLIEGVLPSLVVAWRRRFNERFGAPSALMLRHTIAPAGELQTVVTEGVSDRAVMEESEPVVRRDAPGSRRRRRRSPEE